MNVHFPILQVVIPLLAAPICLIIRQTKLTGLFALFACSIAFIISISILQHVLEYGVISYEIGDWASQWGIEYRIDLLSAFLLVIISSIGSIVLLYAQENILKEIPVDRQTFFYIAYLLCFSGFLGICATGDIFNIFVFLEISSLASYTLISLGKNRRALFAAYQYLIMGTIGATFILISIGLLYMVTGTLNIHELSQRLAETEQSRTIYSAYAFFIVGVCLKLALFPLHMWLPNAYTYAPSAVTAFIAATATKVAIYILIRFIFSIFGVEFSFTVVPMQKILMLLAFVGIIYGSLTAMYQSNVKRLFAYSSIAQIGYIILGISIINITGLSAAIMHLINHALMKAALFMALGAVMYQTGSVHIQQFRGLGKTMPWTMAAIVICGLSLIGIPLTSGFVTKWFLVTAAIENGMWPVIILTMLGSLLTMVYVWRIIETAYFTDSNIKSNTTKITEAPLNMLIPMWTLVLANIYFGIDTRFTVNISTMAAQHLFGVKP